MTITSLDLLRWVTFVLQMGVSEPATEAPGLNQLRLTGDRGSENGDLRAPTWVSVGSIYLSRWKGDQTQFFERPRLHFHVVSPREEIAQIAVRYGVKARQIQHWNKLEGPKLEKGQRLRIRARQIPPPREVLNHVVTPSETWGSVAALYRADARDLRAYNWKVRELSPGQTLVIWIDPGRPQTIHVGETQTSTAGKVYLPPVTKRRD